MTAPIGREHLEARLRRIAETSEPSDDDRHLLLFHFRSSDPSVYQAAAAVLGRLLPGDPSLWDRLERYARSHGLELSGPVPLSEVRGPRRILLLRASARAHWLRSGRDGTSRSLREPDDPLPVARLDPLPGSPRDLAVRLRAETILLLAEPTADRHARCRDLVARSAAEVPRRWDPTTVQRWMELLAAGVPDGADDRTTSALSAWRTLVGNRIRSHPVHVDASVAERVANLTLLDQAVRGLTRLPSSFAARALGGGVSGAPDGEGLGEIADFLTLRYRVWNLAEGRGSDASPGWTSPDSPMSVPSPSPLEWLEGWVRIEESARTDRAHAGGFDPHEPRNTHRTEALRILLRTLSSPAEWKARSPHRRSLWSFLILDALSRARDREIALAALVRAEYGEEAEGDRSDAPGRVILRLVAFEGPGAESMVDSGVVHQDTGDELLLALIPPRRRSDLIPALIDGIEQRLRLRLATDAEASAARDLLRVSVRDPHPDLWDGLATMVSGRTYPLARGGEVDVAQLIPDAIAGRLPEEHQVVMALNAVGNEHASARVASGTAEPPPGTVPGSQQGGVQGDLRRLAALMRERDSPVGDEPSSIPSLILWINRDRSRCLSRTAVEGPSPEAVGERCRGWALRLLEVQERISSALVSSAGILEARGLLDSIRVELPPLLPVATSEALVAALIRLDPPLEDEAAAAALLEHLRGGRHAAAASIPDPSALHPGDRAGSTATDSIAAQSETPGSIDFVLRSLAHPVQGALRPGAISAWRTRVADLWHRSLEEAMAAGYESRVRRLLRARGTEALPRTPESLALLEDTRRWWFDRYALTEGWKVTPLMNRIDGRSRGRIGDAGRFFGAFAPLWLALLIGAVLMLDFGDAWRAMVEAEDLRGIVITFLVGAAGALGYLAFELRQKSGVAPEDRERRGLRLPGAPRGFPIIRLLGFFGLCLTYTLAVTSLMWLLLSRTDEVVHGAWAPAHVVVWAGFALFVGVFFGMIAKE